MRTPALVLAILTVGLFTPVWAQASDWLKQYQQAHDAYRHGKDADAEYLLRAALKSIPHDKAHLRDEANALDCLATICRSSGRDTEAQELLERALHCRTQYLWPSHPKVVDTEHQLAALYEASGNSIKAEEMLRNEIAQREKVLRPNHPKLIALHERHQQAMGQCLLPSGREQKAKKNLQAAEKLFIQAEENFAAVHNRTGMLEARTELAYLYAEEWKFDRAQEYIQKIIKQRTEDNGADSIAVANAMVVGAEFMRNDGMSHNDPAKLKQAESLCARALEIQKHHARAGNPDLEKAQHLLSQLRIAIRQRSAG